MSVSHSEDPATLEQSWNMMLDLAIAYLQACQAALKGANPSPPSEIVFGKLIEAGRRVVTLNPENFNSYLFLAQYLRMEPANTKMLEWCRLNPEERLIKAPEVESPIPLPQEIFDLYEKAVSLDPNDECTLFQLAWDCVHAEKFDRAEELVNHALSINTMNQPTANAILSRVDRGRGNFDSAIIRYRELNDKSGLVETYRLAGQFEKMLSLAETILKECPKHPDVNHSLAQYFESQGLLKKAAKPLAIYREVINERITSNLSSIIEIPTLQ